MAPIIFIIFNRPDTTRRVFETIRAARPERLLVVADGPRADREGEPERCAAARAITEEIDWPCEVERNYSETNLGCRMRVATGITWAFEQVEEAIVLEDDTVPHPSFFRYCTELLEYYRDDERVMVISGDNFQDGQWRGDGSYYFSKYGHIWGWATWRRAWSHYDVEMRAWPTFRMTKTFRDYCGTEKERQFWTRILDQAYTGEIDTWDYALTLARMVENGVGILPNINLVSNIGFGPEATHTTNSIDNRSNMAVSDIVKLHHPSMTSVDTKADLYTFETLLAPAPTKKPHRLRRLLARIIRPGYLTLFTGNVRRYCTR